MNPWSGLVGGSLWCIRATTRDKVCTVSVEEYQPPINNRDARLLQRVKFSDAAIKGRVLSWPKAICRQGNILMIQFVTHSNPYIQFLLVDLVKEQSFVCCNWILEFRRSYALMGCVECCLSPDLKMMMLRLPRAVVQSHTSSITIVAKTMSQGKPMTVEDNPLNKVESFNYRDKKLRTLLFDPRYARRLVYLQVSEYCLRCSVLCRDQDTGTTVLKKTIILGQLSADLMFEGRIPVGESRNSINSDTSDGDSEDSDETDNLVLFKATSCKAEYCRSSERVVVGCIAEDPAYGETYIRVFVFDSNTFSFIAKYYHKLDSVYLTESLGLFQLAFSPCDTKVHVMLPCPEPLGHVVCSVDILKPISLRNFSRSAILSCISDCQSVNNLPLPPSLKKYLLFKWDKFECPS